MFKSFLRTIPEISIFHHPSSSPSRAALSLLQKSLTSPYPPTNPKNPPLEFNLEIVENPPTTGQLRTILSYLPNTATSSLVPFLAPSAMEKVQDLEGLNKLAREDPSVFKWPVVVDWSAGRASVGGGDETEGVRSILEDLRKKRDGEVKE